MKWLWDKVKWFIASEDTQKDIILLAVAGMGLLLSFLDVRILPFDAAWVAILLCGIPITAEALAGLVCDYDITADVLVSLALWASVLTGETFAAGEVACIMQLGALLEDLTVARARAGIGKLVQLSPQTARVVLPGGGETIVDAQNVRVGDHLLVKPGEMIAVDGRVTKGTTSVNQAVMTGESLPVDKKEGDEVFSGTVNQYGAFTMEATKVGEDSSIQRMIRLVQSADAGKAKIVSLADRWAVWIVIGAAATAVLSYLFTGDLLRSVTVLVVFCPCALVLATPTAIMAGIANVTRHGCLVREGDALERLAGVNRVMFDKTGTLTNGTPEVTDILPAEGIDRRGLLRVTASLEELSEHPLGKAIVRKAGEEGLPTLPVDGFTMTAGMGIMGKVLGHTVIAGSRDMLGAQGVPVSLDVEEQAGNFQAKGATVIYTALDGRYAGIMVLADTLRRDSGGMIHRLRSIGLIPTLLTGDNRSAAGTIAGMLGLADYHASCMPEDKLHYIRGYQAGGDRVCMVGDGVNDAPSLKLADAGIAMGGIGSGIAMDAADIVLVKDDVKELPHLFALSRHMMRVIRANLTFSMVLNFIAVTLAVMGILNPVWGALVHNAGSVFVIINSSFLMTWREKA